MKKQLSILLLLGLAFAALVSMVAAQTTVSDACNAVSVTDSAPPVDLSGDYLAGESISLSFGGTGNVTVTVDGASSSFAAGDTSSVSIPDDGVHTIVIDGSNTVTISASCAGADAGADYPPGMICHVPPGNPANAHTINVGEAAVPAHLAHGDTEGPCPEGVDTELELPGLAAVIFIEPLDGIVKFYSDCTDTCENEIVIYLIELIDFADVVDLEGNFIVLVDENPEDDQNPYVQFGTIAPEGPSVVIYYLHPDPEDSTLGVFQINIYFDGILVDDSTLLFVAADGTIAKWTDQSYWDDEDED